MNIVSQIIGESDEEFDEPEQPEVPKPAPATAGTKSSVDFEVEELANLWLDGNKANVIQRFMEMDTETSVKLVFAIGYEGAVELGRMVDQRIEAADEIPPEEAERGSIEPQVIPPEGETNVHDIIGKTE